MLARRSSGAAGLFCLQEIGAKEQAPCPKGRKTTSVPGGGGGWALRALKERGPGPEAPAPLFCLSARGPKGPRASQTPPPPSRTPASPRLPHAGAPPSAMRWSLRGRRKDEADMQGILKPFVNNF